MISAITGLQSEQTRLTNDIASQSGTLGQGTLAIDALIQSVSQMVAESGQNMSDSVVNMIGRLADIAMTRKQFENNQSTIEDLDASQSQTQLQTSLVQQFVQALTSQPIQTAVDLAGVLTEALTVLSDLVSQPGQPTSTDSYATGSSRLRISI